VDEGLCLIPQVGNPKMELNSANAMLTTCKEVLRNFKTTVRYNFSFFVANLIHPTLPNKIEIIPQN